MTQPQQKRGESKQDYQTPTELLTAVKRRLGIRAFVKDVAASDKNAVADIYYTEETDGLGPHNSWYLTAGGWTWCNPPYADITPWVEKARTESLKGANVCVLVPSSVGSNWWKDYVENHAYVLHLNGRLTFRGCDSPYPKDCSLLLYVPWRATGSQVWDWRQV